MFQQKKIEWSAKMKILNRKLATAVDWTFQIVKRRFERTMKRLLKNGNMK